MKHILGGGRVDRDGNRRAIRYGLHAPLRSQSRSGLDLRELRVRLAGLHLWLSALALQPLRSAMRIGGDVGNLELLLRIG